MPDLMQFQGVIPTGSVLKKMFLNQIEDKIETDKNIDEIMNREKSPQKVGNEFFLKMTADQSTFLHPSKRKK